MRDKVILELFDKRGREIERLQGEVRRWKKKYLEEVQKGLAK